MGGSAVPAVAPDGIPATRTGSHEKRARRAERSPRDQGGFERVGGREVPQVRGVLREQDASLFSNIDALYTDNVEAH